MQQGTIARIMPKGYGFISTLGGDKDLFFHARDLDGTLFESLNEGDAVTFEVTQGDRGPQAIKVSLGGNAAPADAGAPADEATDAPADSAPADDAEATEATEEEAPMEMEA